MSLRSRLLLVIGAVSVVALVAADIATYSSLHAFLYNRVDQSLQQSHTLFQAAANRGSLGLTCTVGPGSGVSGADGNRPGGAGGSEPGAGGPLGTGPLGGAPPPTALATEFAEVRTASGAVVSGQECAVYVGKTGYAPALASHIAGVPALAVPTGTAGAPGAAGTRRATSPGDAAAVYFDAPSSRAGGPEFRVRVSALPGGDQLVLAAPLTDTASTLSRLELIEVAVSGGAIIVALLAGWWLVRLGLRPLDDVELTAEAIAGGNLEERVRKTDDRTEVGRLGRSVNAMLERIETAFRERLASERRLKESESRLRQFVGDASHELRTPIAAISAYAELFDRGASGNPTDLARLLHGIRHESARMEQLVGDLLTLARLDEGSRPPFQPVELVGVCAQAVQTAAAVGPEWPVVLHAARPVEVEGDPGALRRILDNLLGNIRSHTPPGTVGRVDVGVDGHQAVVRVSDSGPGMSQEQAAHVFERFYRADPSRSRANGGAGLGLAIVAGIAEAHRGSVRASSLPGQGATFELRLPLDERAVPPAELPAAEAAERSAVPAVPAVPGGAGVPGRAGVPGQPESGS